MGNQMFRSDWYEQLQAMDPEPQTRARVNLLVCLLVAKVIDGEEFKAGLRKLDRPDIVRDQLDYWRRRRGRAVEAT